jgi:hypothetical protein
VRNLLRPSGWTPPPDTPEPRQRYLVRRGAAQFALSRWSAGERFYDVAWTLSWLRKLDRDRANARVLGELLREVGMGSRLQLRHDELLVLLARRLVREGWGIGRTEVRYDIDAAMHQAASGQAAEDEQPAARVVSEQDEISGDLDAPQELDEIEAGLEAKVDEGEIEAGIDAQADDGEIEAGVSPSASASPV